MKTIDAVYVVGPSSRWNDHELRYSLRSLQKFGEGLGRVFIVGHLPTFIDGSKVTHVKESFNFYKERNIMECVKLVCDTTDVSDEFIFMNDDFYLWKATDLINLPYYARPYNLYDYVYSPSRVKHRWNKYTRIIERTYKALNESKLSLHTFDLHVPMRYDKHKFTEAMDLFDWDDKQLLGYASRSLYGNAIGLTPTYINDHKVHKAVTANGLKNYLKHVQFWSTDNMADLRNVKLLLDIVLPKPSRYEK